MKKIVLGVIIIVVLVAVGVGGFMFWKGRTPEGFYEAGKKYYDEKKYPEATISFLNAVRRDSRHRDSRYYLAMSYLYQQDVGRAVGHLRAILEMYPDDVPVSLDLGRLYLRAGMAQGNAQYLRDAADLAQKVLAKEPQNLDALLLSANAATNQKDFDTSSQFLERALAVNPTSPATLLSLGASMASQKNFPEAEKALIKAREANPKERGVHLALAFHYQAQKDLVKEEAVLKEAAAIFPQDPTIYSQLANLYFRSQRFDDVEKVYRDAQTATADNPNPTLGLADFYLARNRIADAKKLLLDTKPKFPKHIPLAVRIATVMMDDQRDLARKEIDQIIQEDPKNPIGTVLLGTLQFRSGELDASGATLTQDIALNAPFPQVHFMLGALAERKGDGDKAQEHYLKSIGVNSAYLPARSALAWIYMTKGKPVDAREELKKVLTAQPRDIRARLLKTELDLAEKKYADVEVTLAELMKEIPNNAAVQRIAGVYNGIRGKSGEAEQGFLRAIEMAPNSEGAYRDLIALYQKNKQPERAIQKLNSVPDAQKQAFHFEYLGLLLATTGKNSEAEIALKKAIEKDPKRMTAERILINLYTSTSRMADAIKRVDGVIQKDPKNTAFLELKGTLVEAQGNRKEAEQIYIQALQANPNLDVAGNNLAYLLAEEGRDLQTAVTWAQGVKKRNPQHPGVADTLGWVYFKMNRMLLAREQAEFATTGEPENGLYQYHLGMIYKSNNQRDKAEIAFKKAVASKINFKEKPQAEAALKDVQYWRNLVKP